MMQRSRPGLGVEFVGVFACVRACVRVRVCVCVCVCVCDSRMHAARDLPINSPSKADGIAKHAIAEHESKAALAVSNHIFDFVGRGAGLDCFRDLADTLASTRQSSG